MAPKHTDKSEPCIKETNNEEQRLIDRVPREDKHNCRTALPQVLATLLLCLFFASCSTTQSFPTIVIPAVLTTGNSTLTLTKGQISWFSGLNFLAVPVGCLLYGIVGSRLGRKTVMMLANVPILVAWIMFHYADSVAIMYACQLLTGLAVGTVGPPILTYAAEITQPHLRGMLSAVLLLMAPLGVLVELLLGTALDWRTVASVNMCFPVAAFIALCFIPESPYWLVVKGRLADAERSLCWLRGWGQPSEVHVEYTALVFSLTAASNNTTTRPTSTWRNYTHQSFLKPFLLITMTFIVTSFLGSITLLTYAIPIFEAVQSPIDKYVATSSLGVLQLAGSLFCIILVRWTGKRLLTLVSTIGNGICFIIVGAFTYIQSGTPSNNLESYFWVPTTFLLLSGFFCSGGINHIPYILIGELFPNKMKNISAGAAFSISFLLASLAQTVFLPMVDGITLPGTFLFNGAVSLLGALYLYFYLPETEGRTLIEIEEHFEGKIDLTRRTACRSTRSEKGEIENKKNGFASL